MWALGVVKIEVCRYSLICFPHLSIATEIDILVFETSPDPFDHDVVDGSGRTIVTDFSTQQQYRINPELAGVLASLITVEDSRALFYHVPD